MVFGPKPFNNKSAVEVKGLTARQIGLRSFKSFPSKDFRQPPTQSQRNHLTRNRRPDLVIEENKDDIDHVIDLGAPRSLNYTEPSPLVPQRRTRRLYVPNPRLYPRPKPKPKPKQVENQASSGRSRRRKKVLRRPVPNSRLYRPAPPRPQPPPLNPRVAWSPPQTSRALDTASHVALRVGEQRRLSPPQVRPSAIPRYRSPSPVIQKRTSPITPTKRLVVTLPQAAGGDSPQPVRYHPTSAHFKARDTSSISSGSIPAAARITFRNNNTMDTASFHSISPEDRSEGNDTQSAPSEILAEFLSAIMRRQYADALKYCRLILQYEPQNATASGFYPLLRHKVQAQRKKEAATERSPSPGDGSSNTPSGRQSEATSPVPVDLDLTPDPPPSERRSSSDGSVSPLPPPPPQAMDQEADSADSDGDDVDEGSVGSVESQSSLELDSSDVMHSSPSVSLSRQTDSACWESTGSASRSEADDNGNTPAPVSTDNTASNAIHPGDLENDNAAGEPVNVTKKSAESLRRLREQFACSIK